METAEKIALLLQTTGGWGLSAVLFIAVWRLWLANSAKDERLFKLLEKQNETISLLNRVERMEK